MLTISGGMTAMYCVLPFSSDWLPNGEKVALLGSDSHRQSLDRRRSPEFDGRPPPLCAIIGSGRRQENSLRESLVASGKCATSLFRSSSKPRYIQLYRTPGICSPQCFPDAVRAAAACRYLMFPEEYL